MGTLRFGEFAFDPEARVLTRSGEPVHLTPKAFDLLGTLIEARPRAVRKQELRERLWPDVVVDESNLKTLVREIRTALGNDPRWIRTLHRFGYAFSGEMHDQPVTARLLDDERVYPLRLGENTIGREPDCQVVLVFTGVSRHHATIRVTGGDYLLEDLGSKNGTWKNDRRVTARVSLHDGDVVRIGAKNLTFRSTVTSDTTATIQPG